MKTTLPLHAAVLLAGLGASSSSSAALSFAEGDFNPTDWTQISIVQTGSSTVTFSVQDDLNGNPGSHWQHLFNLPPSTGPGSDASRVANIHGGFRYDPALSGALQALDFSIDLRGIGSSFSFSTTGAVRPAILQDGVVYTALSSDQLVTLGDWTTASWHFDSSTVWAPGVGSGTPDFSASGGLIQFGYRFGLSTSCSGSAGCRGGAAFTGVDNYRVEITSAVPEPGSWALMLAGVGLAGLWSRRQLGTRQRGASQLSTRLR